MPNTRIIKINDCADCPHCGKCPAWIELGKQEKVMFAWINITPAPWILPDCPLDKERAPLFSNQPHANHHG